MSETTTKVEPALTASEWAAPEAALDTPYNHVSLDGDMWTLDGQFDAKDRHALAALALHGMPFGFTHGMLQALRDMAADDRLDPHGDARRQGLVRAAIDCVEALLPPEGA